MRSDYQHFYSMIKLTYNGKMAYVFPDIVQSRNSQNNLCNIYPTKIKKESHL